MMATNNANRNGTTTGVAARRPATTITKAAAVTRPLRNMLLSVLSLIAQSFYVLLPFVTVRQEWRWKARPAPAP